MAETAEISRIEAIDDDMFRWVRGRNSLTIGMELKEIYLTVPNLSVQEVGELGSRLRTDGYMSATDANKSLAGIALLARFLDDAETVVNTRKHFLRHFNIIGAGLVYLEEKKLS